MKKVSIIIPCYNEEKIIASLLAAFMEQSYPVDDLEVIIADGMSTDGTRQKIEDFQQLHPELTIMVVDNPKKIIPAGLNLAIQASQGEIIIRLDGHSIPARNYVEKCVDVLGKGQFANVGGRWDIEPGADTWIAKGIAAAAANPIGVGDALYRFSVHAGEVDTVPFGASYKKTLIDLNGYDESLLTNEDYELNTRIRKGGGKVWFDPSIRSTYYARSTLNELARQYYRYGYWKAQMAKLHPDTLRWRQVLPPMFVLSIFAMILFAIFLPFGWTFLVAELAIYVVILGLFGILDSIKRKNPRLAAGEPVAIATMHTCWGTGFLIGMLTGSSKK